MRCGKCGYTFPSRKEMFKARFDLVKRPNILGRISDMFLTDLQALHYIWIKCPACGNEFGVARFNKENLAIALGVAFILGTMIDIPLVVLFVRGPETLLYAFIASVSFFVFLIYAAYNLLNRYRNNGF